MNTGEGSERRVVVITGTSRGIGYHLACRFLADGYQVIGISRSPTILEDPNFRAFTVDVADMDQVKGLSDALEPEPIVGLINNAGIHGPIGPFEHTPLQEWVHTFHVNLFGAAALTQLCIPSLRRHRGFITFLSGGGAAFPKPDFSPYGISKTAVVRFSEVLACELAPDVLVYCVAPGPNRTQLLAEAVRGGEVLDESQVVDFEFPERLCAFLAANRDPRYSGKFIHVRDNYVDWDDRQLAPDAHTLRRTKVT